MAFSPKKRANKTKRLRRVRRSLKRQTRETLKTVYRRTTRRQNPGIGAGEDLGETIDIHVMRSFL
jgi:hypothetical protein